MEPLFPTAPKLTARQQFVLDRITCDGEIARSVGIALHEWSRCTWCKPGKPCRYAEADAGSVLQALAKKGLVRKRTRGAWVRADAEQVPTRDVLAEHEGIPW